MVHSFFMPFTENDAKLPDRIKQLPAAKRRQWVKVWNSAFERCQAEGGADCEGAAFRLANGAIAKMVDVGGLQISLEDLLSAMTQPEGGQREMLRQAQTERAKKFGIKVQPGGSLRIPAGVARLGAKVDDFADPVHFKFPVWLTRIDRKDLSPTQLGQVRNAKARFEQFRDRYDQLSRAAVERRIDEAHKKFKVGQFAEMEKAWRCVVFKADEEKRIAYSVALKASGGPNGIRPDTQHDVLSLQTVEDTAHNFLLNSQTFDLHHKEALPQRRAAVVESYLAPVDFQAGQTEVKKGDWIVAVFFGDESLWQDVKTGKISAFSIKGIGRRSPLQSANGEVIIDN